MAREVIQLFEAQLQGARQPPVETRLQLEADTGQVPADPDQLRRAFEIWF